MAGVPREPISAGELVHVTPSGNEGGNPRGVLHEINQQDLRSKYKFKEAKSSGTQVSNQFFSGGGGGGGLNQKLNIF